MIALLEAHDQSHWARRMWDARELLRISDFRGINHVLSAFGGMGGLGDIMLTGRENIEDNKRLGELSSRAYELADAIRREVEREGR